MATIELPKTPLDETLWRDQAWYRRWGPLNHMTVMDYFRMSTFFDNTSNNGNLFQQMQYNMQIRGELGTPELFNQRLKQMTGVEYMLATGSTDTGVWVIRKQLRKPNKIDDNTGREIEDVTVLATYYITGEDIFQAPSVGAVLQNRLLTAITALRAAQKIATNLSSFTPTKAVPSTTSAAATTTTAAAGSQLSQTGSQLSQTGSQQPPPSTQSSVAAATVSQSSPTSAYLKDPNLLPRALALSIRYQDEYMDDHAPLLGDPGSFLHSAPGSQQQSQGSRGGTATPGKKDVKAQAPAARAVEVKKVVAPPPVIGRRKSKGAVLSS